MKKPISDISRLLHILDAINEIYNYIANCDYDEFILHSMMKNATVRQLEIIGEAASRLSTEIKSKNPEIDWEAIIGFRNIIVHEYFGINYEIVWNTIKNDLNVLKSYIERILADFNQQLF